MQWTAFVYKRNYMRFRTISFVLQPVSRDIPTGEVYSLAYYNVGQKSKVVYGCSVISLIYCH